VEQPARTRLTLGPGGLLHAQALTAGPVSPCVASAIWAWSYPSVAIETELELGG
jgi:hypothetical protein